MKTSTLLNILLCSLFGLFLFLGTYTNERFEHYKEMVNLMYCCMAMLGIYAILFCPVALSWLEVLENYHSNIFRKLFSSSCHLIILLIIIILMVVVESHLINNGYSYNIMGLAIATASIIIGLNTLETIKKIISKMIF